MPKATNGAPRCPAKKDDLSARHRLWCSRGVGHEGDHKVWAKTEDGHFGWFEWENENAVQEQENNA